VLCVSHRNRIGFNDRTWSPNLPAKLPIASLWKRFTARHKVWKGFASLPIRSDARRGCPACDSLMFDPRRHQASKARDGASCHLKLFMLSVGAAHSPSLARTMDGPDVLFARPNTGASSPVALHGCSDQLCSLGPAGTEDELPFVNLSLKL
jgi:hypothetical protein